jgi:hypothetical protein
MAMGLSNQVGPDCNITGRRQGSPHSTQVYKGDRKDRPYNIRPDKPFPLCIVEAELVVAFAPVAFAVHSSMFRIRQQ